MFIILFFFYLLEAPAMPSGCKFGISRALSVCPAFSVVVCLPSDSE